MSYKTILVHADDSGQTDVCIEAAARLAVAHHAHLIGLAVMPLSETLLHAPSVLSAGTPGTAAYLDHALTKTAGARHRFENIVRRNGVASHEWQVADRDVPAVIASRARYGDLLVLGKPDPAGHASTDRDLSERVVMEYGGPLLVIPETGVRNDIGHTVMIAWDGSATAMRAVRDALPILRRATAVTVAILDVPRLGERSVGVPPGADLVSYLGRHNVKAEVLARPDGSDVGRTLLALAGESDSDLLVMGCYGHSRLREKLIGGATRSVLSSLTIPVLMSH